MLNRILLAFLFSFSFSADLFISEVAEGSSNNKYIEIFNAGDNGVDLSAYSLSSCSNGCDVDGYWDYLDNVTFEAIVAPGDVYVVCHQSADETILAECDQTFTYLSNGDDLFALTEIAGGGVVDMVGDYGDDPGSGWAVCGVADATKDHTLVRKSSVMAGNSGNWGASAGTDSEDCEWIVLDQNTWDGVGFHEMDSSAMTYIVEAGGYYYAPQTLTIDMGDTVVWENVSGFHDVVSYDGLFSLDACSGPCTIGEITFNNPGEFDYFCSVGNHEQQGMVGTIIVLGEIQLDCTDEAACNFAEPGDCVYPEENYDCDGNCVVETDCSGECGGDAVVDECGECGGNGSSCAELVNLFYSEWAEGSSNNKYIEIFNPSTSDVSLGAYAMGTVGNAPDVPGEYEYWNTFDEGATVSAGDVFVVCHPDADPVIQEECDMTFTYLSNGDDGNCLVFGTESNYTILDCIGDWEADPGDGWDAANQRKIIGKTALGQLPASQYWQGGSNVNKSGRQLTAFDVTLDMLLKDNRAQILTNSQVVTVNGHEAMIEMVDEIPYLASNGGEGNTNFQVAKESVGIKLKILPYVNADGFITTKITPEVSSIIDWTAQGYPWTKKRISETTVRVQDGETIVIAGLISNEKLKTEVKVPLLWRIPIIGKRWFTHTQDVNKKTDLIIQVRPTIVQDNYSGITKQSYHKELEDATMNKEQLNNDGGSID